MPSDAYFWPDNWMKIKSMFTDHKETTNTLNCFTISFMTSVRMKTFQGILLQPKILLGLKKAHQIFLLYFGVYVQEILASKCLHKYLELLFCTHIFKQIGCSETGNKDFLRRSRRQKHGFSIRLTTYSSC